MKKYILLFTIITFSSVVFSQNVLITDADLDTLNPLPCAGVSPPNFFDSGNPGNYLPGENETIVLCPDYNASSSKISLSFSIEAVLSNLESPRFSICLINNSLLSDNNLIENGLIESKRRIKVNVLLEDKPGALFELTETLKKSGANVLHVVHSRDVPFSKINQSLVEVTLESRDEGHSANILNIIKSGFKILPRG